MSMTRAEERKLIRLAAAGDKDAAAAFIKCHQNSLYAYLLRMSGRPDMAEDVVQEAFVRVLTNLDRFDPKYRFSTWLFTIARRLYVNACQKHKPAYDSDMIGNWRGDWDLPSKATHDHETATNARSAIDVTLAKLSPEQREVIVLFHQLDWPIAVIAQHLGMPEGTVKSHLHRGRRKMKALFESDRKLSEQVAEVWR
ncbi:MAG: RNA polymerase sigma factor [Phycisphaerales bacterium]|nr:MAG: RNA polymerase sigma factor [Phycisphaerales bacterium]